MSDKVETMAYNKVEVPWHGLGYAVEGDLTPLQMLKAAKLNWKVEKRPAYYLDAKGQPQPMNTQPLIRVSDDTKLSEVTSDWETTQNIDAAKFFNDFVAAGEMNMETAGSLDGGKYVWFLARINESFDVFKGKDEVRAYLSFTNPHRYGMSMFIFFTGIRVVCWNTLSMSLAAATTDDFSKMVKVSHRAKFDPDSVKEKLGVAKQKLAKYKEAAQFLGKAKAKDENIVEYFQRLFPTTSAEKEMGKAAQICYDQLETQPGAEFGKGTWWQSFNSATYYIDHIATKTPERRLTSAWYGQGRTKKLDALNYALEYANA